MNIHGDELIHAPVYDEEPYDFSVIPEEHCFYCGIHNVMAIVKCQCSKWFCNGGGQSQTSHIRFHLKKSGHISVSNHPENINYIGEFKCEQCNKVNMNELEILPDRKILCRHCSVPFRQQNIGTSIKILLDQNKIHNSMTHAPTDQDQQRARKVNRNQLSIIEKNIEANRDPFEGLENAPEFSEPLPKIKLKYANTNEYHDVYLNMLTQDLNYTKNNIKKIPAKKIKIKIKNQGSCGTFTYSNDDSNKIRIGAIIELQIVSQNFDAVVCKVNPKTDLIEFKIIKHNKKNLQDNTYDCDLKFKFIGIPYQRLSEGLGQFSRNKIKDFLKKIILGDINHIPTFNVTLPEDLSAPGLDRLNESQADCVKKSLNTGLCLIQGPPGTGKTQVSATIVYNLAKHRLSGPKEKILVCSSSNAAVDNLVKRISRTGLKIVKIASKIREKIETEVDDLCLHKMIKNYILSKHPGFINTYEQRVEYDEWILKEDEIKFKKYTKEAREFILRPVDIICCTCITAFDSRLDEFKFQYKYVVIDEANQSNELETLLPLLKGCEQVVLIGDHMQLGPMTKCRATASAGFSRSLFSRLIHMGITPMVLNTQYRMHPSISSFPMSFFYQNLLHDGIAASDRLDQNIQFLWPNNTPAFFWHHKDSEGTSSAGTSLLNPAEAILVTQALEHLKSLQVNSDRIAIITPYEAQKKYLLQQLRVREEIWNIDQCQGSEKDYVIFSSVRSNEANNLGFLNDFRRMNVGITRAKYGMIIIGDAEVLATSKLWGHLIKFYADNNRIFTGSISSLTPIQIPVNPIGDYDFKLTFPYAD